MLQSYFTDNTPLTFETPLERRKTTPAKKGRPATDNVHPGTSEDDGSTTDEVFGGQLDDGRVERYEFVLKIVRIMDSTICLHLHSLVKRPSCIDHSQQSDLSDTE